MMPSAKIDNLSSAPPLNKLTSLKTPALLLVLARPVQKFTAFSEIPGVGMVAPSRKRAMMPSVNSSFLRRSGVRNARRNAVSMRRPHVDGSTSWCRADPADDRGGGFAEVYPFRCMETGPPPSPRGTGSPRQRRAAHQDRRRHWHNG